MEKLLITQALDEKALLVKRIRTAIENGRFTDVKKNNEEKVIVTRVSEDDFGRKAQAAYQQINDLIRRYQTIEAAVIESNARTMIMTSYGEMTVAAAIALRNRLRKSAFGKSENDFEGELSAAMKKEYVDNTMKLDSRNSKLLETAENMRMSILGKENKGKDDISLKVVDEYVKENKTELIDPLNIKEKIRSLDEKRETLQTELDTQIKISNATTYIEI